MLTPPFWHLRVFNPSKLSTRLPNQNGRAHLNHLHLLREVRDFIVKSQGFHTDSRQPAKRGWSRSRFSHTQAKRPRPSNPPNQSSSHVSGQLWLSVSSPKTYPLCKYSFRPFSSFFRQLENYYPGQLGSSDSCRLQNSFLVPTSPVATKNHNNQVQHSTEAHGHCYSDTFQEGSNQGGSTSLELIHFLPISSGESPRENIDQLSTWNPWTDLSNNGPSKWRVFQ
jgi:hypothetical protein